MHERRSADSIWQGIAFRLPETNRSLATPQIFLQTLKKTETVCFFCVTVCFFCVKKRSATHHVSHCLLCSYITLSAVLAVEAAVAAAVAPAQQQQLEQYTVAAVHICPAPYLSPRRAGPGVPAGVHRAPKWHC